MGIFLWRCSSHDWLTPGQTLDPLEQLHPPAGLGALGDLMRQEKHKNVVQKNIWAGAVATLSLNRPEWMDVSRQTLGSGAQMLIGSFVNALRSQTNMLVFLLNPHCSFKKGIM